MDEISLRHIPDLSDADLSDSSFQIPDAARNSDDLLADDTTDFFGYANDALNTPAPPSRLPVHPPLTLAELTPRPKPVRAVVRSSLRPRPDIATPHRAAVAYELSTALSEDLTAFRGQTPSLEIHESKTSDDLLMADSGANFLGASDVCVPGPSYQLRPDQRTPPTVERAVSEADNSMQRDVVADSVECLSAPTAVIPSTLSESVPEGAGDGQAGVLAKKGKSKVLPATDLVARHKKLLGGDASRRKRVLSSAAITKPAKLKPSTASLARQLSNSSKKTISAVRRRPLPSSSSSHTVGHGASALEDASQPFCGGLADTLLSFGQRLAADANKLTQGGEAGDEPNEPVVPEPESLPKADHPPAASADHRTGTHHAGADADADPGYLTLSQLSPQKARIIEQSPSAMLDSHVEEAPAPVLILDHPHTSSDRPPSPMRSSFKRTGSPANESETRSRKRSKTTSGSTGPNTSKGTTLQPSRARNAPAASVGSGPSRARRVASATVSSAAGNRAARADGARKPRNTASRSVSNPGREGGLAASKGAADSALALSSKGVRNAASSTHNGRSGHHDSDRENLHEGQGHPTDSHDAGRSTSTAGDRPLADSHPAKAVKPTKPKEFQFATSSRLQARSGKPELDKSTGGGGSLRRSHANVHPIPDFKALHAAQESVLAQKRAEIQVTKPVEFGLATVSRAQERERYEEQRRARERELERQAEERRRQRELEEEAEIRELRRRAVPKANEVPEWYAFAPKKSKADANAGS